MNSVFMTADAVGGVWTHALDLARGLMRLGVTTTLAVLGPAPSDDQRSAAASVPGMLLVETGAALDWLADDEAALVAAAQRVAALAAEFRPDIVHLNTPALAALAQWPAPVLGACHSCLATWWDAVQDGPMPADFRWRSGLLARSYAACDALVAPSAAFAVATERRYGRRPIVVHNGAPMPAPGPDGPRLRCVLTAGRLWDEGKNLATLDLAASLLDAPLLAAGPLQAPHGGSIGLRHARAFGALTGAALRSLMDAAPIFASLAVYEPFGLSVLEAAQSGCALVLSDSAGFRELWSDAAVFVPARQPDAAAAVLQGLLNDAADTARLGRAAQMRAQRYSAAAMADGMLAVYRGLAVQAAA